RAVSLMGERCVRSEELHLLCRPFSVAHRDRGHLAVEPGGKCGGACDDVLHTRAWRDAEHDPWLDLPRRLDPPVAHVRDQASVGMLGEDPERHLAERGQYLRPERLGTSKCSLARGNDLAAAETLIEEGGSDVDDLELGHLVEERIIDDVRGPCAEH